MTENSSDAVSGVIDQLGFRCADAFSTLEQLRAQRQEIETEVSALENPRAVLEYIDFFVDLVSQVSAECEGILAGLRQGVTRSQVDTLRQIASNSAAEQRRCLMFRDKWINKPLPHERMRPLLNDISVTTRDQLTAFRDFNNLASRIEELLPSDPPAPEEKKGFDRRELFTRLFKP